MNFGTEWCEVLKINYSGKVGEGWNKCVRARRSEEGRGIVGGREIGHRHGCALENCFRNFNYQNNFYEGLKLWKVILILVFLRRGETNTVGGIFMLLYWYSTELIDVMNNYWKMLVGLSPNQIMR